MSRHPFGWDLPAGAANDPRAPYNQPDTPECVSCGNDDAFTDGCAKHAGPVCPACRCPDCPAPSDMANEGPDPDEAYDRERDERAERGDD